MATVCGPRRPQMRFGEFDTNCAQQAQNQSRVPYSQVAYMPNGAPSGPSSAAANLAASQGRVIQQGPVRLLCIADVRGECFWPLFG